LQTTPLSRDIPSRGWKRSQPPTPLQPENWPASQERAGNGVADRLWLPVTRYDIADYLALSVETVSRSLTGLKERGVIALSGPREVRIIDA
jgi:CRP-like cAMP-binding protein